MTAWNRVLPARRLAALGAVSPSVRLVLVTAGLCAWVGGFLGAAGPAPSRVDLAFQKFFAATTAPAAAAATTEILATKISLAEAVRRLKAGPVYAEQRSGRRHLTREAADGTTFHYWVDVPATYAPSRRYPLRVILHGGVTDQSPGGDPGQSGLSDEDDAIVVAPVAWRDAPWWSPAQLSNLEAILASLGREYNIDENRVSVMGVSDGGSGAYFLAMRASTRYAALLPFNGFLPVLGNQGYTLNDRIFPNNLKNKPLFVVNGGRDPLYPADAVTPHVDDMRANRVSVEYRPQPDAAHDTTWWPTIRPEVHRFLAEHPRDPLPDVLTWELGEDDPYNRVHWLIIDRLMAEPGADVPVTDVDRFRRRSAGAGSPLFGYRAPAGRVDVVRTGNTIEATTSGVSEFTLLLSPDELDFKKPVRFILNGQISFDARMDPTVAMLLKWAARDRDRTMLFAAELHVTVEPPP
jgi:acetyl esterase/lipase